MSEREATTLEGVTRRWTAMGLEVEPLPGGRTLTARLRLQRTQFATNTQPIRISEVTLASVGKDRAKCVTPRALFQLPILRIADCRDAIAIEARIHLAWQRHMAQLDNVERWLRAIGVRCETEEQRSLLAFPLAGEPDDVRARMIDSYRVILPSRGPLSGIPIRRADDRVLAVDRRIDSGIDLEIQVSNRLEELARLDSRLAQQNRLEALQDERRAEPQPAAERRATVLVVGPRITQERSCIESLRLRGYLVETAPGEREAIATFDRCSPELVLADVSLGRSEGIDLIQSLRHVPGIEEVPVILIDSHRRDDRREAARRMGAAGYLVYPVDVARIAERLSKIVLSPRRRRFTRYPWRLPVRLHGSRETLLTDSIGRGGMFLATDEELPSHVVQDCEVALPEIGANLRVEAEILYHARLGRQERPGVGVRFNAFPDANEPLLIEYLRNLHPEPPPPAI
jgi:two-component system chemotaxis response regulator CheY